MKDSSFLGILLPSPLQKRHINGDQIENSAHAPTFGTDDSQLESLIERANLDSYIAGRKNSIEHNVLARILSLTRHDDDPSFVSSSHDEDSDDQISPEPPGSELEQVPFVEMEADNAHEKLFRFLFYPIENTAQTGGASELTMTDDLIQDLQNLKDRMQSRYNVIKRNLFNSKAHD